MTEALSKIDRISRFTARDLAEATQRLQSPDFDVVVLPQEIELRLGHDVRDLPNFELRASIDADQANAFVSGTLSKMGLANQSLAHQMVQNIELFASILEQKRVETRLEITDRQSCPKFHCDNVYVRMLVTYLGPTTEFIDHREPEIIFSAPLFSVVFLKGHRNPTYQDQILHRSPQFTNGVKRLTMILNFCDWMGKR